MNKISVNGAFQAGDVVDIFRVMVEQGYSVEIKQRVKGWDIQGWKTDSLSAKVTKLKAMRYDEIKRCT